MRLFVVQVQLLNVGELRVVDVTKVLNWVTLEAEDLQIGKGAFGELLEPVAFEQEFGDIMNIFDVLN